MKTFKKILICTLCWLGIIGFSYYEAYSITKKEYESQTTIAKEAHEKVNFNLDMIKIAVMTEDVETYERNLTSIKEQIATISPLGLVKNEQAEYLESLEEYVALLDSKVGLLKEMRSLKTSIANLKNQMSENYVDKNSLSRDKLKDAKDKILSFKLPTDGFSEEKILTILDKTNELLDGISDKASTLAGCIDTCYRNRINTINDELADKLKAFADSVDGLNADLEKEFDFDKMKTLRSLE